MHKKIKVKITKRQKNNRETQKQQKTTEKKHRKSSFRIQKQNLGMPERTERYVPDLKGLRRPEGRIREWKDMGFSWFCKKRENLKE